MEQCRDLRASACAHQGQAELLEACVRCERLHVPERPLESNHVCAGCARGHAVVRLEMDGVFPLTAAAIELELQQKAPGNYALGYLDRDGFAVFYIGRSDEDVRGGLRKWVDAPSHYQHYAPSGRASWGSTRRGALPLDAPALASTSGADSSYSHFAYSYAPSAEAAYAKHWRNYDDFGGCHRRLDNSTAPAAPATVG